MTGDDGSTMMFKGIDVGVDKLDELLGVAMHRSAELEAGVPTVDWMGSHGEAKDTSL